jgi:2-pyrone-4,6-dicarboxylate lactonase
MNAVIEPRRVLHNPPPDPHPRRPKHRPPPGAWDCHVHLFGPSSRFRFEQRNPCISNDALPEDYLSLQQVLGLSHAVIVGAGAYGRNVQHLQWVLECFPGRFRGVILPPPDLRQAQCVRLHELGVRGIRMFSGPPGHQWSHLPRIDPSLAAIAADAGWHVQYRSLAQGHLLQVAHDLLALPTPVVLDHFGAIDARLGPGQPAFEIILRMMETGRVWVKLSAPMRGTREQFPYPSMRPFAEALVRHAPERVLWGSDWPHVELDGQAIPNDGDLVDLLAEWVPDERIRRRILCENPLELYA